MPRITRAALRAQEADCAALLVREDRDVADLSPPSSDTDLESLSIEPAVRPIFQELTGNDIRTVRPVVNTEAKKTKAKKGGRDKNDKLNQSVEASSESSVEVLEDENSSDTSSAADVAAEELKKDEPVPETFQVPMDTHRPHTPSSAAVVEAQRNLSKSPVRRVIAVCGPLQEVWNTPKFDPEVHRARREESREESSTEDSFVNSIKTRSPVKNMESQEEQADEGQDSFVEDIITRSPNKQTKRIEDSVEEIDAMEEAIEQVAEGLNKLENREFESPVHTRTSLSLQEPGNSVQTVLPPASDVTEIPSKNVRKSSNPFAKSMSIHSNKIASIQASTKRSTGPRASVAKTSLTGTTRLPPNSALLSTSASTKSAIEAPTRKRVTSTTTNLSTNKPGFVPAKSTKPLTKSTFVLPGEAVAAKLKEQREERLRREEEAATEKAKKPEAEKVRAQRKPSRISSVGPPPESIKSRARLSMMAPRKGSGGGRDGKENVAPANQLPSAAPVMKGLTVEKRRSGMVSTATRKKNDASAADNSGSSVAKANSSACRITTTATTSTSKTRTSSRSISSEMALAAGQGTTKTTVTGTKASNNALEQKARGKKEIFFGRDGLVEKTSSADNLKSKRDKEEAAKKARTEAAERGRVASREWAERQKKKQHQLLFSRKTVEETKVGEDEVGDWRLERGAAG